MADFQPFLDGDASLADLRDKGIDTAVVKKAKSTDKGGREIELHDRAGAEVDRIMGHTEPAVGDIVKHERLDKGLRIGDMEIIITTPLTERAARMKSLQ